MRSAHNCADCGTAAPPTDSDYVLISPQYAWRVVRQQLPDGALVFEWRCPSCWARYKERGGAPISSSRAGDPEVVMGRETEPGPPPSVRPPPRLPTPISTKRPTLDDPPSSPRKPRP